MPLALMKAEPTPEYNFDASARMREMFEMSQGLLETQARKVYIDPAGALPGSIPKPIPGALPGVVSGMTLTPPRLPKQTPVITSPAPAGYRKPKKPKLDRFASTDNFIQNSDGSRTLVTERDQSILIFLEGMGFATTDQIMVLAENNTRSYLRRLNQLADVKLIAKRLHPLHKTVWLLTPEGFKYLDTQFTGRMRSLIPKPFKDDHSRLSNVNTLAAKLTTGVDEDLLFDKDEHPRHEPLALLPKVWIDASCKVNVSVVADGSPRYLNAREAMEISVASNPRQVTVKSRYKHMAVHRQTPDTTKTNLQGIYQQMDVAWLFGTCDLDAEKFTPELNPDFIVLRPILETPEGWDFNADGVMVIEAFKTREEYRTMMIANFATGMLGRLHFFRSPNKRLIDKILIDTWNALVNDETLGPNLAPYGEPGCWLSIRDLPEQVSNTGKVDPWLSTGKRMAKTRYDG